jgi:hypothetical protein
VSQERKVALAELSQMEVPLETSLWTRDPNRHTIINKVVNHAGVPIGSSELQNGTGRGISEGEGF